MSRVPPLNFFGRKTPFVQVPYPEPSRKVHYPQQITPPLVRHSEFREVPPQVIRRPVQEGIPYPKFDNPYENRVLYRESPMIREPFVHPVPLRERSIENFPPRDPPTRLQKPIPHKEPLPFQSIPKVHPQNHVQAPHQDQLHAYHQRQEDLHRKPIGQQYGPPPDFYDSKTFRPQEDKENHTQYDPLNYSRRHNAPPPQFGKPEGEPQKPIYYPFIQPTIIPPSGPYPEYAVDTDPRQRLPTDEPQLQPDPDQFEEPAPLIDFYPPMSLNYPAGANLEPPVNPMGHLNQYDLQDFQKEISQEYTRFIRRQVQNGPRYIPEPEDIDDKSFLRKRWEIKEIYGNLKAEFDENGNIRFNNIKGGYQSPSPAPGPYTEQRSQIPYQNQPLQQARPSIVDQTAQPDTLRNPSFGQKMNEVEEVESQSSRSQQN